MPVAQPPRGPSRQALLAEVQALRQRVTALEQEKHDLEVMLEMATDHADDLEADLQSQADSLSTRWLSSCLHPTRGRPTSTGSPAA